MRCFSLSSSAKGVRGKGRRADSVLPQERAVRMPDNCFLCDEAATLACQDCWIGPMATTCTGKQKIGKENQGTYMYIYIYIATILDIISTSIHVYVYSVCLL